jgi:hypothetical protein
MIENRDVMKGAVVRKYFNLGLESGGSLLSECRDSHAFDEYKKRSSLIILGGLQYHRNIAV